jgi:type I restriction enzyme S subunit
MTPEKLLEHFDCISDAPDAIPRLRRFILDLAVRGKLVPQDLNDEPASELVRRIKAEKERMEKEGKIKKEKPIDAVNSDTAPFGIPASWTWTRLGKLTELVTKGSSPKWQGIGYVSKDEGVLFITSENVWNYRLRKLDELKYVEKRFNEIEPRSILRFGDILMNLVGASIGRTAIYDLPVEANINQAVALIRLIQTTPNLSTGFLLHYLNSPSAIEFMFSSQVVTAQPNISLTNARGFPIPVPPLAEQHRIVARVDELMALCERLETAQAERESRRDRLAATSLHRLNNGADADEFREHARFHLGHLPRLATRPEHIQQLRQTILNLAVRGKLVPQNPNDEPACELLKYIQDEKERFVKEGRIRKEKPLPEVAEEDAPFSIPISWSWARIGTCSLLTEYGTSVKSDHIDNGVPVLKMGDIHDGKVILGGQKKVPRSIDDLPQLFLRRFDLLYNRTNSAELVGKTGIYLGEDDGYTFASYLIRIRFLNDRMSPVYSNLAMNAPYFRPTQILPELQQQCGQANVNGTKLRNMLLPIPPLAEQHRIVARVDELMGLCDRLEEQLTTTQTESRRLLEAVLHEALNAPH